MHDCAKKSATQTLTLNMITAYTPEIIN